MDFASTVSLPASFGFIESLRSEFKPIEIIQYDDITLYKLSLINIPNFNEGSYYSKDLLVNELLPFSTIINLVDNSKIELFKKTETYAISSIIENENIKYIANDYLNYFKFLDLTIKEIKKNINLNNFPGLNPYYPSTRYSIINCDFYYENETMDQLMALFSLALL